MRPEIIDGHGIIALDPQDRVILYLDAKARTARERTPMEMITALGMAPNSLYTLIRRMVDGGAVCISGDIQAHRGKTDHKSHVYELTEDGKRIAKVLHHVRKVRF